MNQQGKDLRLNLRSYLLDKDAGGHTVWREVVNVVTLPPEHAAVLICDMWDDHWSRGAAERVDAMAPRMNRVIRVARDQGVHIIHAPSDTLDFYAGTEARQCALNAPVAMPPALVEDDVPLPLVDPPLPIDDSDEGSDTGETEPRKAWSRQHPALEIDQARDAISADGREVYNLLQMWQVKQLLIMGVHTNMCVLNRSFGIKQMVRWQVDIALARDLTDAMYNPARSPYVSHDEGTQLVVGYIERFWCPTITCKDLTS